MDPVMPCLPPPHTPPHARPPPAARCHCPSPHRPPVLEVTSTSTQHPETSTHFVTLWARGAPCVLPDKFPICMC